MSGVERRPIAGAPRFAIQVFEHETSYPRNGNVHNARPRRSYVLLLDGRQVDASSRERVLRDAAKAPNAIRRYDARKADTE